MRAIYVSYDGALDPLGASQVVPYLLGLADRGFALTLISFEKPERWGQPNLQASTQACLEARGIRWRPLRYHKRPRLAATLLDVLVGRRVIAAEAGRAVPNVIHCRGDVATAMARCAGIPPSTRLLYDPRAFFSDERAETGSWRRGSVIDRVVRHIEAENLRRADGAVVLTKSAAAELVSRRPSLPFHRVIPTCVDLSRFTPRVRGQEPDFGLVYSGSIGTWYAGEEMVAFARSAARFVPGPVLFLTLQTGAARRLGVTSAWAELRTVEANEVGSWLCRGRALFFFTRRMRSNKGTCPTKFAEGLASGLPIVCNRGVGDLDEVIESENVGVLVDELTHKAYAEAGERLQRLLQDPDLPFRCRRVAESRFDLELGIRAYCELYQELSVARQNVDGPI